MNAIEIKEKELQGIFEALQACTSGDETRPSISTIRYDKDERCFVSTDGRRMLVFRPNGKFFESVCFPNMNQVHGSTTREFCWRWNSPGFSPSGRK